MGKIRVATLGSDQEKKLKEKQQRRRQEKKKREKHEKVHIAGMKGGERIKAIGMDEAEIERLAKLTEEVEKDQAEGIKTEPKKDKAKKAHIRKHSSKFTQAQMKIDHGKLYNIEDAVPLLRQISLAKFNGSVELHVNTVEKGLRGSVRLPHGTGKEIKVAIADYSNIENLVAVIQQGKIDFDVLVAHPQVMPKLAKVAKFLGPRGLMPNPKNGTISSEPEIVAEKFKGGEINWKTESEFPIIHQVIGRLSFKDNQLIENFSAFVKSVGTTKIKSITLKSTMSPGIKVKPE